MSLPEWKEWFSGCVTLILTKLLPLECAIFYQTDVKHIKQGKYPYGRKERGMMRRKEEPETRREGEESGGEWKRVDEGLGELRRGRL
jgi:hypothetical protein